MPCFEECGCTCYEIDGDFDRAIAAETNFDIDLENILRSHAGWYHDGEEGQIDGDVESLGLRDTSGVYILWRQTGYCEVHDSEHLRAYYVGKAGKAIETRLKVHQLTKEVGAGLATEISLWRGPNRAAKYVEQLLLDLYDFPLNKSENAGCKPLCLSIGVAEWN